MLCQFGMIASMPQREAIHYAMNRMWSGHSRKGDCWECEAYPSGCNAPMESFWGTLKNELVHHRKFKNRQEAIQEITEYIEVFYNRQRKQARLGYLSPAAFTQRYNATLLAA